MASIGKFRWISRRFTTHPSAPLRICVVGSGPAGFYTAEKILKAHEKVEVDVIDRLPTPFGLVRSGVAPDHPETKIVTNQFSRVARNERCSFFGNVCLGSSVTLPELREMYNAVVLTYGAESDRSLGIPGRKVYLVGRRGPVQAACTAKELREVLGIKDLRIHIQPADLVTTPADEIEMKNNRIRKRVYELLSKAVTPAHAPHPGQRELHFVFFRKPDKFLKSNDRSGHLGGVQLEKTILKECPSFFNSEVQRLSLKSIGYKSIAIDGLPFDSKKGIVPNIGGRVLADASKDHMQYETGLYVCGWLKRGPTGIIGTNLHCAEETLSCISDDVDKGVLTSNSPKPGRDGLLQLLDSRNTRVVTFDAWEKIDAEEKRRGNLKNKPREKLTTWEELLKVVRERLSGTPADRYTYILEKFQAELQTEYIQIVILVQGFDHALARCQIFLHMVSVDQDSSMGCPSECSPQHKKSTMAIVMKSAKQWDRPHPDKHVAHDITYSASIVFGQDEKGQRS
ncbi:NADPH:adrenodoxin oxidoreductase, mitochondrial [Sesamum angolense]|uniref:NADPH:adrenodoxin oxidoreductase, mitochondrial n=1 Tax=Sesamum angolense TaxID=2727404 RepID=A0AAE1WZA2_9LAMI|nr:NADPH:adrenodoxin oxidoreductase, mitochondrial [Sesamum angolense]